jgi:hypothetical protein
MKTGILLAILMLYSPCLKAEMAWHDFDATAHVPWKIDLNGSMIEVVHRDVEDAAFKEDHLQLSFNRNGSPKCDIWFTSSYGAGSIALEGRFLFLRYGIGRGTFAREDHVRIYLVTKANPLEEMADVKVSSYVDIPGLKSSDPTLVQYQIQITEDKTSATITFNPPSVSGISLPKKIVSFTLKSE